MVALSAGVPRRRPPRWTARRLSARPSPHETRRPSLPRRRLGVHLQSLPCLAAAEPEIRRTAGERGARLLQHGVEAAAGCPQHRGRRGAHPFRGHLRLFLAHLPQRALCRVQGEPLGAAGRPDPAIRADPRGDPGVRPAVPGDRGLRSRRPHRQLRPAHQGGRRRRDDHLVRQGPHAAGRVEGVDVRPDEGPADRHSRGRREMGRAAGEDDRSAGAHRRFCRQRPRRARHRPEDCRAAFGNLWRPGHAARPGRRDQAGEAPAVADRERRQGAHLARAGAVEGRRAADGGPRRSRAAADQRAAAHRLPEDDGVHHADAAGRRGDRRRSGGDRGAPGEGRARRRGARPRRGCRHQV